ncbi:MAG: cbb3-type cytochrome c oxidase subunit I [Bacteroidota bacterium]
MKKEVGVFFIFLSIVALLAGMFFGSLSAFQFVFPGFFDLLPFFKNRPLHVSLVVSWIFLSAIGGIYYYLPKYCGLPLFSRKMAVVHIWLFFITGLLILACYLLGKFGGREYWEFPAILAIPVFISWVLFAFNYFISVFKKIGQWPVYLWMWATGICFFLFTFLESYLWVFPYFRDNLIRDLTVQWKAYGALTGSWNMLVYGTAIFVMERIKGDESVAKSKLAFWMYFLGLTNLLFGWAHHIYIVPTVPWIRYLAYGISMTELLILSRIIWNWKSSLEEAKKDYYFLPFRFLVASDVWIFLNLILALLISIPAVNVYTHGTHITVAHAMGSAIGINTMILLSSVLFIINDVTKYTFSKIQKSIIRAGFWITNISLFAFLIFLTIAGAEKGILVIENKLSFQAIMQKISPYLVSFAWSGLGIFIGLIMTTVPPLVAIFQYLKRK